MQIVKAMIWAVILFGLLVFSFFNWEPVQIKLWDNLILDTRIPALVIIPFLLGLLPMWLIHRGMKWQLTRRIASLESALRAAAAQTQSRDEPHSSENLSTTATPATSDGFASSQPFDRAANIPEEKPQP